MSKYYAQEKRVFDINKLTVVGSPTITSDGVASGFSGGNYIKQNISFQGVYTLKGEITIGTINEVNIPLGINANNGLLLSLRVYSSNSRMVLVAKNTNGNNTSLFTPINSIVSGNKYSFEIVVNGSSLTFKLNNSIVGTMSNFDNIETQFITLGVDRAFTYPFLGSIDLTAFKIYVDGELVYSPTKPTYFLERKKEGFDISKFTVVGSPTITDDGIASGFSGANYITTSKPISSNNNIFKLKFKYNGVKPESGNFYYLVLSSGEGELFYVYQNSGNALSIYSSKTGATSIFTGPMITLSANHIGTTFDIEVVTTSEKYTCNVYRDSVLLGSQSIAITNLLPSNIAKVNLGGQQNSTTINSNSIDLPSFSIIVDGVEVFTGAKDKFYAMRGM